MVMILSVVFACHTKQHQYSIMQLACDSPCMLSATPLLNQSGRAEVARLLLTIGKVDFEVRWSSEGHAVVHCGCICITPLHIVASTAVAELC